MTTATRPQGIACAQTGFHHHEADWPAFAFASVDVDDDLASALMAGMARPMRLGSTERPFPWRLFLTRGGRKAVERVLRRLDGRHAVGMRDKRPLLAAAAACALVDPVLGTWGRRDLADEARRIVEEAARGWVSSRVRSTCLEIDHLTRRLEPGGVPSHTRSHVFPTLRRFLKADEGRLEALCGEARRNRPTEDAIWERLTSEALLEHLASWSRRHPAVSLTLDDDPPMRTLSASLQDGNSQGTCPVHLVGPIRIAPLTDPRVAVAKIVAAAAIFAVVHPHVAGPSFVDAIDRHWVGPRYGASVGARRGPVAGEADPSTVLTRILEDYADDVGWGRPARGPASATDAEAGRAA